MQHAAVVHEARRAGARGDGRRAGLRRARTRAGAAARRRGRSVLVVLFQRGAVDGLNMVVPHGDPAYYARAQPASPSRRPSAGGRRARSRRLLRAAPGAGAAQAALGRARGSPPCTRAARPTPRARTSTRRTTWRRGTPGVKSTPDGWLARGLPARAATGCLAVPRRRAGPALPRVLRGDAGASR